MNERLKQLAIESKLIAPEYNGFDHTRLSISQQRFAELIVIECAKHALDFNNNIQSLQDKVMRGNLDRVQDYIKDRMGVEE